MARRHRQRRRHAHAVSGLNDAGVFEASDQYFRYDAMNRQTTVDGEADGSLGADGHRLTYDKSGNRTSDTHNGIRIQETAPGSDVWTGVAGETKEDYGYDALGRLANTYRDGVAIEGQGYDAASRVVATGPSINSAIG